ncbi:adenine phosphoribosyltransferase [Robertkochia solimangrovi]|uniref:adenine phosphoribosyltransferase n=1 Tax=Robertkochia solimangrovi TaxID=2213046 RepID=UPI00117E27D1|nr:adenine phosphoribosyltransferase [Robertkochia solimangrovi]TRZ43754.1 adenine phosphoribosyltransferase [Robertkochia solimangrovi]
MELTTFIRDIPDFPKPGVLFKDITPLLNDYKATRYVVDQLYEFSSGKNIDRVVAMESRGFFFGMLLAERLQCGFVPVRKPGKLPAETITEDYSLEYGTNSLQMHTDAIQPGERVLIHDDVLATGGTAKAACDLVERLGGEVIQLNFLMELTFLKGAELLKGRSIESLLQY